MKIILGVVMVAAVIGGVWSVGKKYMDKRTPAEPMHDFTIPIVTNESETFDVAVFDTSQGRAAQDLPDGTHIEYEYVSDEAQAEPAPEYRVTITPPDSYFSIYKIFYENGTIQEKGLRFTYGGFYYGQRHFFNERGEFQYSKDNDKPFYFSFKNLHQLLREKQIPLTLGYEPKGPHTSIEARVDESGSKWIVRWPKAAGEMEILIIDGKTGAVLERSEYQYNEE